MYISGYETMDGYFIIRCNDCGYEFKYNAQIIRPSRNKNVQCKNCNETEKKQKEESIKEAKIKEQKIKEQIKRKQKEMNIKIKSKEKECFTCGEKFITTKTNVKCCSDECRRKRVNRNKDKRIYTNGTPDTTITLEKLIRIDNNICHICDMECNREDYTYTSEGYFIAGDKYPSIDHVVPITKGGVHQWDNVKLAHRICNTIKSNNI